jgi:hypothetical protein
MIHFCNNCRSEYYRDHGRTEDGKVYWKYTQACSCYTTPPTPPKEKEVVRTHDAHCTECWETYYNEDGHTCGAVALKAKETSKTMKCSNCGILLVCSVDGTNYCFHCRPKIAKPVAPEEKEENIENDTLVKEARRVFQSKAPKERIEELDIDDYINKSTYGKFDQSTLNIILMREHNKLVKAVNELREGKNG